MEQKLHGHAYAQANGTDIQLVSGMAVLYPWFGDVATNVQSTWSAWGHSFMCGEPGNKARIALGQTIPQLHYLS